MTFAAPLWYWGFAVFPFLIALAVASERRRAELLQKVVASRLAPKLAGTVSIGKRRLRFAFLLLSLAFVLLTLSRPQWGFTWEQAKRKGRDVLIAIDTSRSMLADDLKPSRLTRAKLAAQDLIGELRGDRVGIVAFAGTAFLQAPLTIDYGAVLNSLKELDTEVIPQGGSNLAGAIKAAMDAFGKGESENRALIIFSDGEELDANAEQVIADLKGQVRIFAVGLGTPEGALIPIRGRDGGTEFVKDDTGNVVRSKLDETRLRAIAEPTGGFYVHLETGRPEMQQIVQDGLGKMTEHDIDAKLSRRPIERYQWPLAAALFALIAGMFTGERRRGTVLRPAVALLAVFFALPLTAGAKNEGLEAYERKDYTGARQEFTKQLERRPDLPELEFNLGNSAYKAGDYDAALGAFGRALTAKDPHLRTKAAYNLGNTLFQRGAGQQEKKAKLAEWKNALQHYDEALKADPQNEDAVYNRDIVRKLIEELEKEPPKQDDQQQKQQDKDKDKDKNKDKDQQQKDKQDQQKQIGDQKKDEQQQQSGGGKDQDQQKQDGSQQPPPKEGNEQGKDQKDQQNASNEDQKQEQGDKEKEQKPEQRDGKDAEKKQDQQGNGQPKDEQGQSQPPGQPEQKKEGELKSAPEYGSGEQQQTPEEQAAAEAQAAAEGKMTPEQARALLESLRGEDKKVQLLDPRERRAQRRVLKDW